MRGAVPRTGRILVGLCLAGIHATALGNPMGALCEEGCSGGSGLMAWPILIAAALALVFGWHVLGEKSLKMIYGPAFLGCALLYFFLGMPASDNWLAYPLLPVAGLLVGWVVIGCYKAIEAFTADSTSGNTPPTLSPEQVLQEQLARLEHRPGLVCLSNSTKSRHIIVYGTDARRSAEQCVAWIARGIDRNPNWVDFVSPDFHPPQVTGKEYFEAPETVLHSTAVEQAGNVCKITQGRAKIWHASIVRPDEKSS